MKDMIYCLNDPLSELVSKNYQEKVSSLLYEVIEFGFYWPLDSSEQISGLSYDFQMFSNFKNKNLFGKWVLLVV